MYDKIHYKLKKKRRSLNRGLLPENKWRLNSCINFAKISFQTFKNKESSREQPFFFLTQWNLFQLPEIHSTRKTKHGLKSWWLSSTKMRFPHLFSFYAASSVIIPCISHDHRRFWEKPLSWSALPGARNTVQTTPANFTLLGMSPLPLWGGVMSDWPLLQQT